HQARLLALADLTALVLPLAIGAPGARAETTGLSCGPEADDVDAAIGFGGVDVDGAVQALAAAVPGHLPVARSRLDGGDDVVRDLGVNVEALCGHGSSPSLCDRAHRGRPMATGEAGARRAAHPHGLEGTGRRRAGCLLKRSAREECGLGRRGRN